MRRRFGWLLPASFLLACGGGTTGGNGTAGDGGSAAGGSAAGGTSSSACPSQPPPAGFACNVGSGAGLAVADCTWGDDPRPACRVAAVCTNNIWSVTQPPADCAATPPLPAACPAAPLAVGVTCSDPKLACWYADGTVCNCSDCQGGSPYPICRTIDPPQWTCKVLDPFCGLSLPQAGTKCEVPDAVNCGPSCELPIRCQNGAWQYGQAMCPMCAAPSTPIATPAGERAISELTPGDLVYSVDELGVVVVPILRVGSTPVVNHSVVRVELRGGAVLEISAGHPTADGRTFADLLGGGQLDDHAIVSAEMVPYAYARTYDILPDSSSGTYFAAGALIGSTLAR